MRLATLILSMTIFLLLPATLLAAGVEMAIGGWYEPPRGDVSCKALTSSEIIGAVRELRYDDEFRLSGRLKLDVPGPLPNLYLMFTAIDFEGRGRRNVTFSCNGQSFSGDVECHSKVNLDSYDAALYWGIPLIERGARNALNLEIGINVRIVDFEAQFDQPATGLSEYESFVFPFPMGYVATQVNPVDWLAVETEFRGMFIDDDSIWSLIGRVKIRPSEHLFIAAGWRHEDVDVEENDVRADIEISGPLAEVGLEF